jgi:hypothetical protein
MIPKAGITPDRETELIYVEQFSGPTHCYEEVEGLVGRVGERPATSLPGGAEEWGKWVSFTVSGVTLR